MRSLAKWEISQATFFNWKKKYGSMGVSDLRKLRQLYDVQKISKRLIQTLVKLGDLLDLRLTIERLQKLTESYVVINNKIKMAKSKPLPI